MEAIERKRQATAHIAALRAGEAHRQPTLSAGHAIALGTSGARGLVQKAAQGRQARGYTVVQFPDATIPFLAGIDQAGDPCRPAG